jgi:hypothetical protein
MTSDDTQKPRYSRIPYAFALLGVALVVLVAWLNRDRLQPVIPGTAAPEFERLSVNDDQSDYQYDNQGNVLGGLRTPYVDVPAARLSGEANVGLVGCRLSGTTMLFDAATMATLYIDRAGYIDAVIENTDAAVSLGALLPEDAKRIKAAAALQWDAL